MLNARHRLPSSLRCQSQRGVALPVVLILLVVVTVLGIAGARIALLGERSTRFDRDYQIAWESAEAALVDAEFDIDGPNTNSASRLAAFATDSSLSSNFAPGCNTVEPYRGLCQATGTTTPIWRSNNFDFVTQSTSAPFVQFGAYTGRALTYQSGSGIQPALPPHYIIEQVADARPGTAKATGAGKPTPILYRITSIGFGPNRQTYVLMQSIYAKE